MYDPSSVHNAGWKAWSGLRQIKIAMVIVMRPITRTIKRADACTRHDMVLETNTCFNAGCRTLLSTSLMKNYADAFTRHDVVLETNTCINAGCRTLLSTSLMANHAPRLKVNDDSTIAASLRRRSCRCSSPPARGRNLRTDITASS